MHIFGEEIRLDPEQEQMAIAEDDWAINRPDRLMDHRPSGVLFFIDLDETAKTSGQATLFDFKARPVHICQGRALPGIEEMTELGRAAILLYLEAIGCLPLRPVESATGGGSPDLHVN
ncbi:MAG TPA: hypothetical protein VMT32_05990 [Bryobacteraceae bacterium]|nr:hypothetical protein [Bryobacteraceae bacterium]